MCLVCTAAFEALPLFFIRMFGADGELYTLFAVRCLRIYLSLILLTCVQKVCAIFQQSIGRAKAAAPLSVLRDVLLILFSVLAPMVWGVTGIFWAAPIADLLAIAITAAVMIRLWNQLKAADGQREEGQPVLKASRPGVIVTIAREHGTAGKRVGQLVAERLGIPCYYKEMTALAAQESGLAREFISGINSDENAVMRELYLSTSAVQQAVIAQDKAINRIADMGSCVIVGRAADMCCGTGRTWCGFSFTHPRTTGCGRSWRCTGIPSRRAEKALPALTGPEAPTIRAFPVRPGAIPTSMNSA